MRKNQKGFTLVELIIAVAILAVVTLAVCGFIVVGSRSYTSANTDIMLQQDAQLALNQMSDVIIDTTESISYSGLVGGSMQTVLKDSEFSGEVTDKCLTVVNKKPETDNLNQNPSYWFYYSKDDETIYFNEVHLYDGIADTDAGPTESEIKDKFDAASTDKAVLVEHVTDFSVDVSQFEQNRVVMLALTFENGNRMYSTSNNVTVRNRIAINDITVGPMKRADEFVINAPDSITLEPGETYTFTGLKVNGEDAAAGSIRWSLLGEEKNGTTINEESGTITIGAGETRKNFKVVATRAEYADSRSTKEVTVQVKRVTDVSLTCAQSTVKSGDTVTINATAIGNYLGVQCNGCPDSPAIDYDVTDWTTTNATKGDATARKLEITIASGLTDTDEVVIEATSLLSTKKEYDNVTGQLKLKVEKGTKGDYPINPGFKFGTQNDDSEDGHMIYDYMYDGLSDYSRYVFAVRVRELGESDISKDRVIVYYGNQGKNLRFNPDMFGLELNRDYEVYLQVILPVNTSLYQGIPNKAANQFPEDSSKQIEDEYRGNLDKSTGKYIGTRYEASGLFYGRLTPPAITVKCNDVNYPNSIGASVNYALIGGGEIAIDSIYFGEVQNIRTDSLQGRVMFSIYDSEISEEHRVSGYNPEEMRYDYDHFGSGVNSGMFSISNGSSGVPLLAGSNYMRRDKNKNDMEALGTYYIVPGYKYANKENLGGYTFIIRDLINPDFEEHYYLQPNAAIPFVVELGFNMEMYASNGVKGVLRFPLPTDSDFPFDLKKEGKQELRWWAWADYEIYNKDTLQQIERISLKPVCTWDKNSDTYTVVFENWDGKKFGTYKCKYGDKEWTCVDAGDK